MITHTLSVIYISSRHHHHHHHHHNHIISIFDIWGRVKNWDTNAKAHTKLLIFSVRPSIMGRIIPTMSQMSGIQPSNGIQPSKNVLKHTKKTLGFSAVSLFALFIMNQTLLLLQCGAPKIANLVKTSYND